MSVRRFVLEIPHLILLYIPMFEYLGLYTEILPGAFNNQNLQGRVVYWLHALTNAIRIISYYYLYPDERGVGSIPAVAIFIVFFKRKTLFLF